MSNNENRREHYRIRYPISERPTFKDINFAHAFTVIDLSESGMRLISPSNCMLGPESKLKGKINLPKQMICDVTGSIIRITEEYIIVKFNMGIEYSLIIEQQRYLLQKFGNLE